MCGGVKILNYKQDSTLLYFRHISGASQIGAWGAIRSPVGCAFMRTDWRGGRADGARECAPYRSAPVPPVGRDLSCQPALRRVGWVFNPPSEVSTGRLEGWWGGTPPYLLGPQFKQNENCKRASIVSR